VSGVFTVLAGLYDMRRAHLKEEVHARVHRHMKVGLTLAPYGSRYASRVPTVMTLADCFQ
jgi:hypothetical protein